MVMMIREFEYHIAWTDVMKEGRNFIGLIEFQRKLPCPLVQTSWVQALWVFNLRRMNELEAENAAADMLEKIDEITPNGKVIYCDGVAL
jgi:hypothetical protein